MILIRNEMWYEVVYWITEQLWQFFKSKSRMLFYKHKRLPSKRTTEIFTSEWIVPASWKTLFLARKWGTYAEYVFP